MCCEGLIDKLPQLETCCCCCKVSTGSKIIAWIGTIGALLYAVMMIVAGVGLMKSKDSSGGAIAGVFIAAVIVAFYCIMELLLLLGLYQEDSGKVKLWLRVSVCMFFVEIVGLVAGIVSVAVGKDGGSIISTVISAVLSVLFQLYTISVVKSHYHNMDRSYDSGRA